MSKSLAARWDSWWCRTAPPHVLALFRIVFGLFLFVEALTYIPGVPVLFSDHGLVFSQWSPSLPSSIRILFDPPGLAVAWIIFTLYGIACLCLALGCLTRISIATLIILFAYYWQLSFYMFPSSYHRLFFVTLLILLFSGSHKTFSLHMFFKRGSVYAWEPINILPQRLLSAQITATYIGVSWQKMWLPDWQNGKILYYSFIGKWGSPPAFWLAQHLPLWSYDLMNHAVKITEFFLPFCLWIRQWRLGAVVVGTLFHLSIAILLGIWWFLVLPPAYILFLEPEDVLKWLQQRVPAIRKTENAPFAHPSIATSK